MSKRSLCLCLQVRRKCLRTTLRPLSFLTLLEHIWNRPSLDEIVLELSVCCDVVFLAINPLNEFYLFVVFTASVSRKRVISKAFLETLRVLLNKIAPMQGVPGKRAVWCSLFLTINKGCRVHAMFFEVFFLLRCAWEGESLTLFFCSDRLHGEERKILEHRRRGRKTSDKKKRKKNVRQPWLLQFLFMQLLFNEGGRVDSLKTHQKSKI